LLPRWSKIVVRVGTPIYLDSVEVIPQNYEILLQQAYEVMDRLYELLPSWSRPEKRELPLNRVPEKLAN